jgi:membrane AbrB-like protein
MHGMRALHLTARCPSGIDRAMPSIPPLRTLLPFAETLLIATAGGVIFTWAGFPAGLVSGSMLATAVAALLGRPISIPLPLARVSFILIGILLGAVVTPETLRGMATWPLSIALLIMSALAMIVAASCYLRFVHGWEPLSALLGASPGSMAQVMALSAEFGSNIRGIAIVQTVRVLIVTVGLPSGLALFGLAAPGIPVGLSSANWSLLEFAILATASTVTAVVMQWIKFPGGLLFGAMAASAVLHGSGFLQASLPWWLGSAGVVVLGAVVGSRFVNTSVRVLMDYFWAAIGSAAVAIAVSSLFVLAVTSVLPFRVSDVMIAFAPGAQDTMMVLALALHLDPVYVGAHHLTRFLVVTFSVALSARHLARRLGKAAPTEEKPRGDETYKD